METSESWEDTALGVLLSLIVGDISPGLAEEWLRHLLEYAEAHPDVAEVNDLPQPMG